MVHKQLLKRPFFNVACFVVLEVLDVAHSSDYYRALVRIFHVTARHDVRELYDAIIYRRAAAALHLLVIILALAIKLRALALVPCNAETVLEPNRRAIANHRVATRLGEHMVLAMLLQVAASKRTHRSECRRSRRRVMRWVVFVLVHMMRLVRLLQIVLHAWRRRRVAQRARGTLQRRSLRKVLVRGHHRRIGALERRRE